jgi:hypothetical protein
VIGAGVYVFRGSFDLPEIAAERRGARGWWFLNHKQPRKAVDEFRIAVEHAGPQSLVRGLYTWAIQSAGTP